MNEIVKSRGMSKTSVSDICKRAGNRDITFNDVMDKIEGKYILFFSQRIWNHKPFIGIQTILCSFRAEEGWMQFQFLHDELLNIL